MSTNDTPLMYTIYDHRRLRTMPAGEAPIDAESWAEALPLWWLRQWPTPRCTGYVYGWSVEYGFGSRDMETGSLGDVFVPLFSSSLLWISAQYKWRRHGFLPPSESVKWRWIFPVHRIHRKVTLSGTDRLWDLWVRTIAYVERLFDCFPSISFLSYYCTGLCSPGGLHIKRGIM